SLEARDVRFELLGVEAEVLEPVVRAGVAAAQRLGGARARDVDHHAAVLALAADEAIPEHPDLVVQDLEREGLLVPLGCLAGIGLLQMDVIDAERHGPHSSLESSIARVSAR